MKELHKSVRSDCKGHKEQKEKVCGVLRVIRNKVQHFEDLGPKLRNIFFGTHEGVVKYFVNCFPKLLLHTYRTVIKSGLKDKLSFQG